jgi:hypothetical protein
MLYLLYDLVIEFVYVMTCRRQLLSNGSANKHVSAVTDALATIEELWETVSYTLHAEDLYEGPVLLMSMLS